MAKRRAATNPVQAILDAINSLADRRLEALAESMIELTRRWEKELAECTVMTPPKQSNAVKLARRIHMTIFMEKEAKPMEQAVNHALEFRRRLQHGRDDDEYVTRRLNRVNALMKKMNISKREACKQFIMEENRMTEKDASRRLASVYRSVIRNGS